MKTKSKNTQQSWRKRMFLLHGAMIVAPIVLLFTHAMFRFKDFSFCLFKSCAGIDCPACGITRSAMATFSGHIPEAFQFHPGGPIIILLLSIIFCYFSIVLLTKYRGLEWTKEVKSYSIIEMLMIGVLVTGWIGKLLTQ